MTFITNTRVYAKGTNVNFRSEASLTASVLKQFKNGEFVGFLKHVRYLKNPDGTIQPLKWFGVSAIESTPKGPENVQGWIREDVCTLTTTPQEVPTTEQDGNSLLNNLVSNDQKLYHSLLRVAENIRRLKLKGKNVATHESKFVSLAKSYAARQEKIKTSGLVKFKTGYDAKYSELKERFSIGINGIGAFPLIPVAIGAVVGIGASIAIYYAFKPDYDTSKQDLVVSGELESLLAAADPDTRNEILTDLEGQIDKAYNQGKKDQKFESFGNTFKTVGLLALGAVAVIKLPEWLSNQKGYRYIRRRK